MKQKDVHFHGKPIIAYSLSFYFSLPSLTSFPTSERVCYEKWAQRSDWFSSKINTRSLAIRDPDRAQAESLILHENES